jgi:hypothetical protein
MNARTLVSWKTARYLLIMIILGAVGSGAWEWILKPALAGASSFLLSVATLGMERFKDSLYKDIALGFREDSSLKLFTFILAMVPSFLFGVSIGMLSGRKITKNDIGNSMLDRVLKKAGAPLFVLSAFLVAFSLVQVAQTTYINRAITHFHQLLAIAGPYMSQEEIALSRSKFAQVSSKSGYVQVVEPLRKNCRVKGLEFPSFSIW